MKKLAQYLFPLLVLSPSAFGSGREAVRPAPGLVCMSLKFTEQQARDVHFAVPLLRDPEPGSPRIGQAASIVLARSPVVSQNRYIAAVLFNGQPGWILASTVMPWRNPSSNGQQCVPYFMSDGGLGPAMK